MYNALLHLLDEDEENKNEIIGMNQSQISNTNYIENAIAFKKQQNNQKKNAQTSNAQKPDMTTDQSTVSPGALSRTVSTFRPSQPSVQQNDTLPTNVSSEITLPESQTPNQQEKRSKKKSVTLSTSTPVKRISTQPYYRNTPLLQAIRNRNDDGKIVCPFPKCGKQYVSTNKLATHLVNQHGTELAVRDRRALSQVAQSPQSSNKLASGASSLSLSTPRSTSVRRFSNQPYYRNTPLLQAITTRIGGRFVCPFPNCQKKYVSTAVIAAHLVNEHYTELAVRDRRALSQASGSSQSAKKLESSASSSYNTPRSSKDSTGPLRNTGAARKRLFPKTYSKL